MTAWLARNPLRLSMASALSRQLSSSASASELTFRKPTLDDAKGIYKVMMASTLDKNSPYCYMIFAEHFAETGIVATHPSAGIVGFIQGYALPQQPETVFVWQIAVDKEWGGKGVAKQMLNSLVDSKKHSPSPYRFVEASVTPSNQASQNLFKAFARERQVPLEIVDKWFNDRHFPTPHEAEDLFRIGPLESSK